MDKLKIAVIFGGASPEYDVSLESAYSVITHMDNSKYEVIMLGITPSGKWLHFKGSPEKIKNDSWNNPTYCIRAIISPCRKTQGILSGTYSEVKLDAAMPILHGKNGEDGTFQGLLELAGIPIVGCKTLSSALCMDKNRAHKIVSLSKIKVAQSIVVGIGSRVDATEIDKLGYPLFVKPVRAGSSFGITKVTCQSELPAALELAFRHDDNVIIQENIQGVEIGCAILGNDNPMVGALDEIELTGDFFDYKQKYTLEATEIHVPARISSDKTQEIIDITKKIYSALDCSGFARVDMFLTPSGEIYFNEVNTIPGFTPHSRYARMFDAIGVTYEQIIDTAIEQAVNA
ncbi:MAG: D-alanine--D-serine ligase VanG [Defluviitaleaceae bacterium]|nr:D-alanine--D-serine ligase VanG [Defluviitaleaceae bacterium]